MDNIWQLEEINNDLVFRVHESKFALILANRESLLCGRQLCLIEIRV